MAKFNAGFLQCNQSFEEECVGPSKANYEQRMSKVIQSLDYLFIIFFPIFCLTNPLIRLFLTLDNQYLDV